MNVGSSRPIGKVVVFCLSFSFHISLNTFHSFTLRKNFHPQSHSHFEWKRKTFKIEWKWEEKKVEDVSRISSRKVMNFAYHKTLESWKFKVVKYAHIIFRRTIRFHFDEHGKAMNEEGFSTFFYNIQHEQNSQSFSVFCRVSVTGVVIMRMRNTSIS
jgi:hypothetical protein